MGVARRSSAGASVDGVKKPLNNWLHLLAIEQAFDYAGLMFTLPLPDDLTVVECADALAASVEAVRRAEAERLLLAVHWADVHPPGRDAPRDRLPESDDDPGRGPDVRPTPPREVGRRSHGEAAVRLGGEGTPEVAEFAAVELGMLLQATTYVATSLMRDALDLRHRLPETWQLTVTGQVDAWRAREAATRTRSLTAEQARAVDHRVVEALVGLPPQRARDVIDAAVVAADSVAHEARLRAEQQRRYVAVGRRPNPSGNRTLICQTAAGDVARLDAMVNHLAEALARQGDEDPLQLRRAKAFAILADPARACQVIARGVRASVEDTSVARPQSTACDETRDEPGPAPELEDRGESAVDRAAAFGEMLVRLGPKAQQRLRPRSVIYVHLAEEVLDSLGVTTGCGRPGTEVARVRGLGPVGIQQLKDWLGEDRIEIRPVIDPAGQVAVDDYEIPAPMAEAVRLREPFEVFPWGSLESDEADLDHTVTFRPMSEGGPPAQTGPHNLGPLGRRHHRAKTFGRFRCHQPFPGLYLWQSPSGHWFQVDHAGSRALGRETPELLRHGRDDPGDATAPAPRTGGSAPVSSDGRADAIGDSPASWPDGRPVRWPDDLGEAWPDVWCDEVVEWWSGTTFADLPEDAAGEALVARQLDYLLTA